MTTKPRPICCPNLETSKINKIYCKLCPEYQFSRISMKTLFEFSLNALVELDEFSDICNYSKRFKTAASSIRM